ncbi:Aste57867_22542 [Aphanomyces stellatus]|uniref:Aste57867_22542 protein n=1 Tax=Aphanomyces stellatus TaxID=120398 RepID=A0A485LKJ1_9STRA|nr:hypothetical protein As57867_022472 [Aphanomyces stellatus]VFT99202.1 Aste57867_22542 [Aphanomyces stellatus]
MGSAASVDQLPDTCTKEQCQTRYGDLFNETEWQKYAVNGAMTRDTLAKAFADLTDAFLTHDWGTDGSTHKKVSTINKLLKARGITTWFDEEKMEGNVKKQMIHGIDNARVIVVFVTQRYIDKVGGSNAEDNCQLEFNYAARRKTASKMIPVLIDPSPSLKNPATWTGEVGFVLGGHLYLDLSNAFDDEKLLATRIDELVAKIVSIGGTPVAQRFGGGTSSRIDVSNPGITSQPIPLSLGSAEMTVPLVSLTKEDVAMLLNGLSCSKFSATFLEHEITGEILSGVANVDEIKELGVSMTVQARLLFDKIADFKSNGVPVSLMQPTASILQMAVDESPKNEQTTFAQLKDSMLPQDWVQLYKYKLDANGRNSLSSHALEWKEPCCSLSPAGGFFANGDYLAVMASEWSAMMLDDLHWKLDKGEFLLSFRMKPLRGDGTPLCGGEDAWFAIDIFDDMALVVTCNQGDDIFPVKMNGDVIVLKTDTWVDIAVLMDLKSRTIQVVVDRVRMDRIELEPTFTFKRVKRTTQGNKFCLVRRPSFKKMFHGHLSQIELFSNTPANRVQPSIPPIDPTLHELHLATVSKWVADLRPRVKYPTMNVDVVNQVTGSYAAATWETMVLPGGSFSHPDLGAVFDGDYYDEACANVNIACAGVFGSDLNRHMFVFAATFVPLGYGYIMTLGWNHKTTWFGVFVTNDMNVVLKANDNAVKHELRVCDEPLVLTKGQWVDLVVHVRGTKVIVAVNGSSLDKVDLGDGFEFQAPPGQDNALYVLNYNQAQCFYGYVQTLEMWST